MERMMVNRLLAAAQPPPAAAKTAPTPAAPAPIDIHATGNSVDDLPSATLRQRISGLDLGHPTFLKTVGIMELAGTAIGAVGGALVGHPALGAAIGAATAGVVLAGYGIYAGRTGANQLEHPEKWNPDTSPAFKTLHVDPPPSTAAHAETPADLGWAYQDISFSSHGTPLQGWYVPCATHTDKTVIFLQGHGDDKRKFLARHGAILHEKYNLVAFDLRNQGQSGGTTTTMGFYERDDMLAAIEYAKTSLGATKIGIMGLSMGGATVLEAAAASPDVKAVISDSPYASVADQVADVAGVRGYPLSKYVGWAASAKIGWDVGHPLAPRDPINAVPTMTQPLLLIHGDADDYVLPQHSERLSAARPANTTRWVVPGARHVQNDLVAGAEYKQRVQDFFDKNL
ncbi:MAG: alpha/beta hydrolase [Armatimonadetes bacterium]|nr:alpha/beta hydrolase [Armatimonadota bacterium]